MTKIDRSIGPEPGPLRGLTSTPGISDGLTPVPASPDAGGSERQLCPWDVLRKRAARNAALLPALGMLGWASLPAAPVAADHFVGATGFATDCSEGDPAYGNMTDNSTWVWNYHDLAQDTLQALEWARVTIFEPTDMTTSVTEDPSPSTDMVAYDQDYTTYCDIDWDDDPYLGNVWGATVCVSVLSNDRCNRHEVRYDLPDMQALSAGGKVGLACHESGHATGLAHRDNPYDLDSYRGCMYTSGPYKDYLSLHDIDMINTYY